ncbi:hypothetical protein ATK36_3928 [Amycolatopsis sulphurea]|uniref:Uncharacterized protein n=1 Tax=Amycolatopsis sulphurea TaxID=76022 RepID=A0A2A9FEG8_9PSEU|nr:hypothetical protein ATK36_3928 [Amycolatopsis sulphurea]
MPSLTSLVWTTPGRPVAPMSVRRHVTLAPSRGQVRRSGGCRTTTSRGGRRATKTPRPAVKGRPAAFPCRSGPRAPPNGSPCRTSHPVTVRVRGFARTSRRHRYRASTRLRSRARRMDRSRLGSRPSRSSGSRSPGRSSRRRRLRSGRNRVRSSRRFRGCRWSVRSSRREALPRCSSRDVRTVATKAQRSSSPRSTTSRPRPVRRRTADRVGRPSVRCPRELHSSRMLAKGGGRSAAKVRRKARIGRRMVNHAARSRRTRRAGPGTGSRAGLRRKP